MRFLAGQSTEGTPICARTSSHDRPRGELGLLWQLMQLVFRIACTCAVVGVPPPAPPVPATAPPVPATAPPVPMPPVPGAPPVPPPIADGAKLSAFVDRSACAASRALSGARFQRFSISFRIAVVSYGVLSTPDLAKREKTIAGTREPGPQRSTTGGGT